jgi:uncharacterized protein YabE (DUF348 family)
MSSNRTAATIVTGAGIKLRDADVTTMQRVDNFLASGGVPGLEVNIDRAARVDMTLFGKPLKVYTQASTVKELLKEENVLLDKKTTVSSKLSAPIIDGMKLEVFKDGTRTITVEESIKYSTRYIQDANRGANYREIQTTGKNGQKTVTYEIKTKNGKQVSKKEIASVTNKQPVQEVVIVGVEKAFSGEFAEALAKLRSCEGGYNSWNPAGPYYGAYQFDRQTWAGAAPAGAEYGNATPAQQDQAARNLYERRGWQPWPVCGASLPDIYR